MLVFDGLSVFLVSQMLVWAIKGGNNAGVDTFPFSKGASYGFVPRFHFCISNRKTAGPEMMSDCDRGLNPTCQSRGVQFLTLARCAAYFLNEHTHTPP